MGLQRTHQIDLSVVIPAYNEAKRLPPYLDRLIACAQRSRYAYELLVINDGSTDRTAQVVRERAARVPGVRFVTIRRNRGKGYAVRRGLLAARGRVCVFLDADGSVPAEEIERHLPWIAQRGYDVVIGSRVLRGPGQALTVRWHRKALGAVLNRLVHAWLLKEVRDTQCGFKMFRREIIRPLFARLSMRGFGFDMEILCRAFAMGYRVKEVPVSWHHVPGSKVNLLIDPIILLMNIWQLRRQRSESVTVRANRPAMS